MSRPCPGCGGVFSRHRHNWLFRCEACGLLRGELPVTIPEAAEHRGVDETMREDGLSGLRHANNARLLGALGKLHRSPARLLDVGSGPGFLLSQAKAEGFEAHGIEPDANTVEAARRSGAKVRQGYFPDVLERGEQFDIIVFNDVLEHIPDVEAALAASAAHLAAGGVLCLNCPSRHGLFFQAASMLDKLGLRGPFDRLWQRGLPSPHLWYFTPADLRRMAVRHGLQPAQELRLETVQIRGLWARIRCVRDAPLHLAAAAYVFAVLTWPIARLAPSDAAAIFLRKETP